MINELATSSLYKEAPKENKDVILLMKSTTLSLSSKPTPTFVINSSSESLDKNESWRINEDKEMSSKIVSPKSLEKCKPALKSFYLNQNDVIRTLTGAQESKSLSYDTPLTRFIIYGSVVMNVTLFAVKLFAAIWSGSLAVAASALDSFLDLVSGGIVFVGDRLRRRTDKMEYPVGREKIETVAVLLFAVVMSMSMMSILLTSVQKFLAGYNSSSTVNFDIVSIVVLSSTIGAKFIAGIIAKIVNKRTPNPIVAAYGQDHINDVLTNAIGTAGAAIAGLDAVTLWWMDPLAASLLAIYIIVSWSLHAREQIKHLTGLAAPSTLINELIYLTYQHHPLIVGIDTVRAYHSGSHYVVEVHIILPEDLPMKVAHDIGESLTLKIESLPSIERAFIHLDVDGIHNIESEHRTPFTSVAV